MVVGLGNPGEEYEQTRHNVGARVVTLLADRHGARLKLDRRCRCRVGEWRPVGVPTGDGEQEGPLVLAFPQTYMNDSGIAARQLVKRYSVGDLARLVVVHDEMDLPPGTVRIKQGGGTAGHKGLESLRTHLHDAAFLRVRIGIGKPPSGNRGADFVLRRPSRAECELLATAVELAADAVEEVLARGADSAMNRYNA